MSKTKDAAVEHENRMVIWDAVSKTDPAHTKKVEFGRKFTAIDAHYQVMCATQQFGPVGAGWGYNVKHSYLEAGDEIIAFADLTLWWRSDAEWENIPLKSPKRSYGPVRGAALLKKKGKVPDTDAPKKAMTDALTKALSHLGFSADVFLGKFDDNKYVQQLEKEKSAEAEAALASYREKRASFVSDIQGAPDSKMIDKIVEEYADWISSLEKATALELHTWVAKQKKQMSEGKDGPE